jgi:omega-amidase
VKVGLVQYNPVWEDKTQNRERIYALLNRLNESVSVMIFPELTLTGFTMRSRSFAEPADGESVQFFKQIAAEYKTHVCAGFIEQEDGNYFNTLVHIMPQGKIAAKYRKIHPFSYSGENRFYKSGENTVISQIGEWSVGLSICYDLRFPELFRHYAKERVDMLINIANWPNPRIAHWSQLLAARAIENQAYMIGVNRVGWDKKNNYPGRSAVIDPFGITLCNMDAAEGVGIVEIDTSRVTEVRKNYSFLDDMRLV